MYFIFSFKNIFDRYFIYNRFSIFILYNGGLSNESKYLREYNQRNIINNKNGI
jgi:hypothetical protein